MITIFVSICMMNNMLQGANIMVYIGMDLVVAMVAVVYYIWKKIERFLNKIKDSSKKTA